MCGRYLLGLRHEFSEHGDVIPLDLWLRALFGLELGPQELAPREVGPMQSALAVRRGARGYEGAQLRWGLDAPWAKRAERARAAPILHARAETAAQKPAFAAALRARRCVLPASAFIEWEREGKPKQPWCIALRTGEPFGLAALWEEQVEPASGALGAHCAILTTEPNELMQPIHHRMPVVLTGEALGRWLDPSAGPEEVQRLLVPYAAERMHRARYSPPSAKPSRLGPSFGADWD
jgi:putative SOS response-associated peptidase YedK